MGFILGLLGAGGAILTIPILVYLVGMDAQLAISCSLFVVCLTSLTGGLRYLKNQQVNFHAFLAFGIASVFAVWFSRAWILPAIPDPIIQTVFYRISKSTFLMLLFALLLFFAAFKMIRKKENNPEGTITMSNSMRMILNGVFVGCITGILGAGGGFLIVPALVILQKLDFKTAAGTSLCIISFNSAIGFISNLESIEMIDWSFLLLFTGIAISGIVFATMLSPKLPAGKLKNGFGYFLILIGIIILSEELYSILFNHKLL